MEALDTDIPQLLAQIPGGRLLLHTCSLAVQNFDDWCTMTGMNTTQKVAANPFDVILHSLCGCCIYTAEPQICIRLLITVCRWTTNLT